MAKAYIAIHEKPETVEKGVIELTTCIRESKSTQIVWGWDEGFSTLSSLSMVVRVALRTPDITHTITLIREDVVNIYHRHLGKFPKNLSVA